MNNQTIINPLDNIHKSDFNHNREYFSPGNYRRSSCYYKSSYKHRITLQTLIKNRKLIIISILILLTLFIILFSNTTKENAVSASTVKEKYFTCIEIDENDTLWGIAEEYAGLEYKSNEDFIKEVKSINNLTSDTIYAGASIVIPIYK